MRAVSTISASSLILLSLLFSETFAGCSKPEDPSPVAVTNAPAASAPLMPSSATAAIASASAAPSAGALAAAPVAFPDGGVTCGLKGLPDCPMQKWMKDNTAAASQSGDLPALAKALDAIVKMAPAGYSNWVSIAKDGADAARAGVLDAVRASCTECHKQYKNKYKTELRARSLP